MKNVNEKIPLNKLILLYFVEKTAIAISNAQITQFMLTNSYMDYFSIQECIIELLTANYLAKTMHNKKVLYLITEEGTRALAFFHHIIPHSDKKVVNEYLQDNGRKIQFEQDVSANYFPTHTGEYLVKCAIVEGNGDMLMELSLVTGSKDHAKKICGTWRNDTSLCYKNIMEMLHKGIAT